MTSGTPPLSSQQIRCNPARLWMRDGRTKKRCGAIGLGASCPYLDFNAVKAASAIAQVCSRSSAVCAVETNQLWCEVK